MRVYLAGPMTGIPEFNFPAFDTAAADLRSGCFEVISPAELDRESGFDEEGMTGNEPLSDEMVHRFAHQDLNALLSVEGVVVLPGWEQSTGARNEVRIAGMLGHEVWAWPAMATVPVTERFAGPAPVVNARASLLAGAEAAVNGDRDNQYGDPRQDFQRTAWMWGAYLDVEIAPHDVAAMMGLLKISRIRWSPGKQDSWMDLAGYAACGWDCAAGDE